MQNAMPRVSGKPDCSYVLVYLPLRIGPLTHPPLSALKKEFQKVDKDGSGTLNVKELRAFYQHVLEIPLTIAEVWKSSTYQTPAPSGLHLTPVESPGTNLPRVGLHPFSLAFST